MKCKALVVQCLFTEMCLLSLGEGLIFHQTTVFTYTHRLATTWYNTSTNLAQTWQYTTTYSTLTHYFTIDFSFPDRIHLYVSCSRNLWHAWTMEWCRQIWWIILRSITSCRVLALTTIRVFLIVNCQKSKNVTMRAFVVPLFELCTSNLTHSLSYIKCVQIIPDSNGTHFQYIWFTVK